MKPQIEWLLTFAGPLAGSGDVALHAALEAVLVSLSRLSKPEVCVPVCHHCRCPSRWALDVFILH